MKTIGFNGYIYGFSVDYDAIAVNDFLDIHKYLMKKKKNDIKMFFTGLTILSSVNPLSATPLNAIPLSGAPLNAIPLIATLLRETPLKCVSVNNQECKVRPEIVNC